MRAYLVIGIGFSLAGCFKSDAPSCTVHCAIDTDCPGAQTCTAAGMCSTGTTCSSDQPDGPTADSGPTAPLTVSVFNSNHAVLPGAQVLFIDPSGAQIADTDTDGNGLAVHDMPAGSSIAVVRRDGSTTLVSSFVDLPLGASIESEAVPLIAYDQITLSWTAEAQIDEYWVYATCGVGAPAANTTTGTSIQILLDHRCSAAYDAIVVGRDTSNSIAPVGQVVSNVSGNFAFAGAWSSLMTIVGQVQGVPSNSSSVTASAAMFVGAARRATEPIATSAVAGDVITDPLELPATSTPLMAIDVTGAGTQTVLERGPMDGSNYDASLDGAVLPWISDLAIDLAGRRLRWTATDPSGPAEVPVDAVFAEMSFQRSGAVYVWDLVAPGARFVSDGTAAMGELVFPDLPGDVDFVPRTGDTVGAFHTIAAFSFNPSVDLTTILSRLQRTWFDRDFFADAEVSRVTVSHAE
jgi:hypothetical protein